MFMLRPGACYAVIAICGSLFGNNNKTKVFMENNDVTKLSMQLLLLGKDVYHIDEIIKEFGDAYQDIDYVIMCGLRSGMFKLDTCIRIVHPNKVP